MDGLPKNKKPWGKAREPKQIALDDYLFGRKLQEVYDKKQASDDLPALVKKATIKLKKAKAKAAKILNSKKRTDPSTKVPKKARPILIDSPVIIPKKFNKQPKKDVSSSKKIIMPKKSIKWAVPAVLAALLLVGIFRARISKNGTPAVEGVVSPAKPDFDTVLPKDSATDKKVKFDPTKRVASFEDTIDGGRIVVSQQQLGETELKDTDFLRRTAVNFNLNTELTTKKGSAYIGTNIEKNVQIATFIYRDFLFFIQTERTYKNQQVIDYIQSLQ